jgi:hypothetical protein
MEIDRCLTVIFRNTFPNAWLNWCVSRPGGIAKKCTRRNRIVDCWSMDFDYHNQRWARFGSQLFKPTSVSVRFGSVWDFSVSVRFRFETFWFRFGSVWDFLVSVWFGLRLSGFGSLRFRENMNRAHLKTVFQCISQLILNFNSVRFRSVR